MTTGLAVPESRGIDFPRVVEEGRKKAEILRGIVDQAKLARKIGGSEHLEVEAWQTIAQGYGYTPKVAWSKKVESGGWEARAVVLDGTGLEVSAAEAECGTDGDDNWLSKPSFQQRSMAQTRAVSKALRTCLSWVVVLAGYKATPAEEMEGVHPAGQTQGPASTAQPLGCPTHHVPFGKRTKEGKTWWSHPLKGTSPTQWCNRPEGAAPAESPRASHTQTEVDEPSDPGEL